MEHRALLHRSGSVDADVSDLVVRRFALHGSGRQADLEGVWGDGDAGVAFQGRQGLALGDGYVERVQQGGEVQEELHPREDIPQAHPPPDAEWEEVLRLRDFPLRVDESRGVEFFRLVPKIRVHVDRV